VSSIFVSDLVAYHQIAGITEATPLPSESVAGLRKNEVMVDFPCFGSVL